MLPLVLTPLADASGDAVEAVLDAAFGADRRTRTAYRLRVGATAIPALSVAAWDDARLVGTLQSWPVILRGPEGDERLIMVGPVAVLPDLQGSGIGKALMNALVAQAKPDEAMLMIGDPDYYGRWGFTADATAGWRIDGPYERHRLLARLGRAVAREGKLIPLSHFRESANPAALATAG